MAGSEKVMKATEEQHDRGDREVEDDGRGTVSVWTSLRTEDLRQRGRRPPEKAGREPRPASRACQRRRGRACRRGPVARRARPPCPARPMERRKRRTSSPRNMAAKITSGRALINEDRRGIADRRHLGSGRSIGPDLAKLRPRVRIWCRPGHRARTMAHVGFSVVGQNPPVCITSPPRHRQPGRRMTGGSRSKRTGRRPP